jgi:hypothetical protein
MRIGLGIGLNRFRGAGAAITGLLDQYTGAAAAFSLDTLIYGDHSVEDTAVGSQTNGSTDTYTVRVRRSSDNAVRSFTHTEVGNGTLVTWVGAGNDGFVEAWYNQGSANDAVQATAANQPKIVDAGSLVLENGKAALQFEVAEEINLLVNTNAFNQPNSVFSVATIDSVTNNGQSIVDGITSRNLVGVNDIGKYQLFAGLSKISSDNVSTDQNLYYALFNAANSILFVNQQQKVSGDIGSQALEGIRIGHDANLGITGGWGGNIQNVIIYNSDQSTNRPAIEQSINDYYEIY